jgi:hypothetical protein
MWPKRTQPCFASENDAEFEWLLCLAAALQGRKREAEKAAAERRRPSKSTLLRGLEFWPLGLRRGDGIRTA